MNDNIGRSHDHDVDIWKQLYEAALLELDRKLLPSRIAAAQKAIGERASTLLPGNGDSNQEREVLRNAHILLDDLKRIYQANGRAA
jgi:hypothetical protein